MAKEKSGAAASMVTTSIYGITLSAPARYSEGHSLTAIEANELNRLILENAGNNFRPTLKKAKEAIEAELAEGEELGSLAERLGEENVASAQAKFVEIVEGYKFGISKRSGAGSKDPIEKEAQKLCRADVVAAYADAGHKMKDINADEELKAAFKEAVQTTFEANREYYMGEGAEEVRLREEAAKRRSGAKVAVAVA